MPAHTEWSPAAGIDATFVPAGHILGASSLRMQLDDDAVTVGFSGDLGRANHPFLVGPQPIGDVDVLLVESTYGDRAHPVTDPTDGLADVINGTLGAGGSVLIPAFAVDRTEVMLHHLARLVRDGRLPRNVPVYVDSPMALSALGVRRRAFDRHEPPASAALAAAIRKKLDGPAVVPRHGERVRLDHLR